jgi:hypothetical protein
MELIETRSAYILSLLVLLVIPAVITGLQINYTSMNLRFHPIITIIFSVFFYIFICIIPAWSYRMNPSMYVKQEWFTMMILLYLLWSTLLYTLGQVLWSYLVLIILIIISIFPLRSIFQQIHPAFACLYLIAFLWLVYLLIVQTVSFFKTQ